MVAPVIPMTQVLNPEWVNAPLVECRDISPEGKMLDQIFGDHEGQTFLCKNGTLTQWDEPTGIRIKRIEGRNSKGLRTIQFIEIPKYLTASVS